MTAVLVTALLCFTALAALVLLLRHLETMRMTRGELEEFRAALVAIGKEASAQVTPLKQAMEDLSSRVQHIDNRTKRT